MFISTIPSYRFLARDASSRKLPPVGLALKPLSVLDSLSLSMALDADPLLVLMLANLRNPFRLEPRVERTPPDDVDVPAELLLDLLLKI